MSTVGLPEFLSDVDIKHQLPACTSNDPRRSTNLQQTRTSNSFPGNDNSGGTFSAKDLIRGGCGDIGVRCDFTIFVPNGTTTDYFQQTMNGQKLFEDRNRLRYVSVFNTKCPLVFVSGINIFNMKGAGRSSEVERSLMVRWVIGSILHGVDPLSYFSFQPVLHDWCNKGCGVCYPVCGMVHIKEPLLLIDNSSLCGGSGFPFSLSEWSLTICLTPYNRR